MIPRRVDVWLNDVSLREAGDLLVSSILESPADEGIELGARPGWLGQRVLGHQRKALSIQINVAIRAWRDMSARAAAVSALNAWACNGGILRLSYRPDQILYVQPSALAVPGNIRKLDQEISVTLTAYTIPYWRDLYPARLALSLTANTEASDLLTPIGPNPIALGSLDLVAEAAVSSLSVDTGMSSITLQGLSIPAQGTLHMGYDERGLLQITSSAGDRMHCRTAASSDDFWLQGGTTSRIRVTCSGAASCLVEGVGLWP